MSALHAIALDTYPDIRHHARMPSSTDASERDPQPDLSSWPTHTEAAAQLATNERTIRRWIQADRLKAGYRPAAGRKPVAVVDPADVERLRGERKTVVIVETAAPENSDPAERRRAVGPYLNGRVDTPEPGTALDRSRSSDPFAGLAAHLARIAAAFPAPQPKPWLGLAEAAEYSGLPRAWLIAQARSGALRAVNVGQGTRERWRFNREALIK